MSAKNRGSSKGKSRQSGGKGGGQRRGVSGNPQRRAAQLRESATGDLAYRMAGGADPAPWWPESHERVLARARAASWPEQRAGVEDLTCQLVGGELHDCVQRYGEGHHPAQWLVALTEAAGAALRSSLASDPGDGDDGGDAGDWRGLWSLLRGISLTAPRTPHEARGGPGLLAHRYFPGIKDPHDTALAEAGKAATLLAARGAAALTADGGSRAAGTPLLARDEYGSRFLLAAPFGYDGEDFETAGHWYAWDIDACWIDAVVGVGRFGSAAEALADWRDAVGPRASGAVLAECPPELTARLLRQSLETGPFSEFMRGDEPRDLMLEYYRERRRARELSVSLGGPPDGAAAFMVDMDKARDEFLEWYAARHGADAVAPGMAEAVDTITDQWGPHKDIDDLGFLACSPHRIETAARLIRNGHYGEHARPAIRLLPEWTQWCVERTGLSGDAAARARGAAMSAAAALADASAAVPDHAESVPFRRPE
ncbi:MAG TPA: hypothetical protein VF060_02135 [Trebonia sp.]